MLVKKEKEEVVEKENISIRQAIAGIVCWLVLIGLALYGCFYLFDYADFVKKRDALTLEQSRKNIHIAEDLAEKEFDQNKKYFRLKTGSRTDTVYLHENTGYIWTNKHLEARLELGKEKYVLYFHTKKVQNKDERLDIYEPVELSKVLKEQEE